jgi:hypothetical protein
LTLLSSLLIASNTVCGIDEVLGGLRVPLVTVALGSFSVETDALGFGFALVVFAAGFAFAFAVVFFVTFFAILFSLCFLVIGSSCLLPKSYSLLKSPEDAGRVES